MKRLIFFARNLEIGGLERALVSLLGRLDLEKYRVTLVLEEKRGPLLSELDARIEVKEYRLSSCAFAPLRKLLNYTKRQLWTWKNKNRYDFACSYCTYSVIGSRLAQAASENSCLYVHNDYRTIYPEIPAFCSFFDELRVGRFAHILFVSNESREGFLRQYAALEARTRVINNIVEDGKIRELAAQPCAFKRREGETVLAYLGRLEEAQKRLSRLLEGFYLARQKRGDLRLLLIGSGPDRALCERLIAEYGLTGQVELLGAQENPYPYLNAADCLVLTSDYEGFPVVYYEALVLGKDIITTVPVSDELIDIADTAAIAEKSANAVAQAIRDYRPAGGLPFNMEAANQTRIRQLESLFNE